MTEKEEPGAANARPNELPVPDPIYESDQANSRTMSGSNTLQFALRYAQKRWFVFPCHGIIASGGCTCGDAGCTNAGKHPRIKDWPNEASCDRKTLRSWWAQWPDANIGCAMGKSNLVMIDTDPRNGGDESIYRLVQQFGKYDTVRSLTGGDGTHDYFRLPPGTVIRSRSNAFGDEYPGVDVKSAGGYAILPPSLHRSGKRYAWEERPDRVALIELPSTWMEALARADDAAHDPKAFELPEKIREGKRNSVVFRCACSLRDRGLGHDAILAALRSENEQRCQPPLTDVELVGIVNSALKYPPTHDVFAKTQDNGSSIERAHLVVTRADHIVIERVEWLSPERIPLGGVTLFDGPGGLGKTTFMNGIIAKATRGRDFFTGSSIEPLSCLVVGVEDRRSLIAQRLKLYEADLTRVHFVDAAHVGDRNVPLVLPDHLGILEQTIVENEIGLVYVDALFSHIALAGEGRMAQQVRAALQPIGEMCERQNVAFAAMRHWTKSTGSALSRALGSVEFTNFARSVFTFGQHPNDDDLVVCSHTKTNYAKLTGAVAFKIVAHDILDDNGQPWQVSIASDVARAEGVSSDDLSMKLPGDPDERTSAAEWLRDHLADGTPHLTGDVLHAASKARAGSRTTLWRAARSIGVTMDRTAAYPSVGTWALTIASDRSKADEVQATLSGFISHIHGTTEADEERDAPETLATPGSDSRFVVVPTASDDTTSTAAGTTVAESPAPPQGGTGFGLGLDGSEESGHGPHRRFDCPPPDLMD